MKTLMTTLSLRKAVGVYLAEKEIVVCKAAATLAGPVQIALRREPYGADDLDSVLENILQEIVGAKPKRRRIPVAVGVAASRFFFGTRPARTAGDASPESMLQKTLQSPAINIDDLVIDVVKTQVNKVPLATMAACRKKYLGGVMAALSQSGIRPCRIEPAPCALVRLAEAQHRVGRRAKLLLRVFLGPTDALAVLATRDVLIAWRRFELKEGLEAQEILSAVRTLTSLSKHYGIETPPEYAIIHGRSDLHAQLQGEEFASELGTRVVWKDGPEPDGGAIAYGLALGCLKQNVVAFDLSKSLKPPASIREIFPWGELAVQGSLVAMMGLALAWQSSELKESYATALAENRRHKCLASTAPPKLEKEKKELQQNVDVIRRVLQSRIVWTAYTSDLPTRLPTNMTLTTLHGVAEMEYLGSKKEGTITPKKYFLIRGNAPLSSNGSTPREIDQFLQALRDHPLLKRDFPNVVLADIKRYQMFNGSQAMANFTVMCTPAEKKVVAATGDEGHAKKEEK